MWNTERVSNDNQYNSFALFTFSSCQDHLAIGSDEGVQIYKNTGDKDVPAWSVSQSLFVFLDRQGNKGLIVYYS